MSDMSYWSEHVQARALRRVENVWGKVRNSLSLPNWRVRLHHLRCFDQQRCRLVCVAFALVQGSAAAVHISAANLARREKRVRSGSQTRHTWRPSICIGSCEIPATKSNDQFGWKRLFQDVSRYAFWVWANLREHLCLLVHGDWGVECQAQSQGMWLDCTEDAIANSATAATCEHCELSSREQDCTKQI